MGWEERRGRSYYYRSRRVGDRVRKVYVGGGVLGEIAALEDELQRLQNKQESASLKEEWKRLEEDAAFLQELEEVARILTRAHLIANGYHQRKGTWRRARREQDA